MQLKIQRSQRAGGAFGTTVFFCLDVRADYSNDEQDNIRKYRLGGEVIYSSQAAKRHLESAGAHLDRTQEGGAGNRWAGLARGAMSLALAKMNLNISIASLGRGHHIECRDLEEMLEAEDTVRTACKGVTRWLDAVSTFNGSEVVISYEKGEEQVHIAASAPPLLAYAPAERVGSPVAEQYEGGAAVPVELKNATQDMLSVWFGFEELIARALGTFGWKAENGLKRSLAIALAVVVLILLIKFL